MWWCSRANVTTDTLGKDREVILDSCTAGMSSMQSTKNVQSRPLDDLVKKKKKEGVHFWLLPVFCP